MQQVANDRTFANKPTIILVDESDGNLDSKTGSQIMELLTELNLMIGTTIIVDIHDEMMALNTEKKMVIDDGKMTNMLMKRVKTNS